MQQESEFLTTAEVAARLRVNKATVVRWIASGNLPAVKIGKTTRVASAELERMIAASQTAMPS